MGEDFDATGHLSRSVFDEVGVPRDADVLPLRATRFMSDMKRSAGDLGVARSGFTSKSSTAASPYAWYRCASDGAPNLPSDDATLVRWFFARSGIAAHWKTSAYGSILELAEACDVPVRWSCRTVFPHL